MAIDSVRTAEIILSLLAIFIAGVFSVGLMAFVNQMRKIHIALGVFFTLVMSIVVGLIAGISFGIGMSSLLHTTPMTLVDMMQRGALAGTILLVISSQVYLLRPRFENLTEE